MLGDRRAFYISIAPVHTADPSLKHPGLYESVRGCVSGHVMVVLGGC